MSDLSPEPVTTTVPGRACGSCTMCCKVIAVTELDKAAGVWCAHCVAKKGCGIYDTRPPGCRTYYCHWMLDKNFGPEWKPDHAKFALVQSAQGITAFVDPGSPGAWRRAPYYETFRRWAAESLRRDDRRIVAVRIGLRSLIVLPDREIDVGEVGPDESIRLEVHPGGRVEVRKFKAERAVP